MTVVEEAAAVDVRVLYGGAHEAQLIKSHTRLKDANVIADWILRYYSHGKCRSSA